MNEESFVVCEPQPLMLQALLDYLGELGHTVLASTPDLDTAIAAVKAQKPDILLLGLERSAQELSAIRQLRVSGRQFRVLVYGPDHPDTVLELFRLGADAYVLRTAGLDDLTLAIGQLKQRTIYLANPKPERGAKPTSTLPLTQREADLLARLASSGARTGDLAMELGVAEQTVKYHLTNIYRKLGVKNRTEAAVWAREHGLA